ncbi:hypothetical protein [Kitasatospora terrestris]|uniref:ABC transporter permease n=1 Tax=Kitasatospora terrestris TaxID=258051 RepID=A0ABP9DHM1_9ACTN
MPPPYLPQPERKPREVGPELRTGALLTVAGLILGLALGLCWLWLAPRVMFDVKNDRILYVDPEGEQRIGADGVFALLGLACGVLSALAAFLFTRARGGGIGMVVGLALGGIGGSVVGWQLGMKLGPTSDIRAHALQVGNGHRISGALELGAHGALLVWPMSAMIVVFALTAAFGKREEDPPPYWAGPQWSPPPYGPPFAGPPEAPGAAPAPARPGDAHPAPPVPPTDAPPAPPAPPKDPWSAPPN